MATSFLGAKRPTGMPNRARSGFRLQRRTAQGMPDHLTTSPLTQAMSSPEDQANENDYSFGKLDQRAVDLVSGVLDIAMLDAMDDDVTYQMDSCSDDDSDDDMNLEVCCDVQFNLETSEIPAENDASCHEEVVFSTEDKHDMMEEDELAHYMTDALRGVMCQAVDSLICAEFSDEAERILIDDDEVVEDDTKNRMQTPTPTELLTPSEVHITDAIPVVEDILAQGIRLAARQGRIKETIQRRSALVLDMSAVISDVSSNDANQEREASKVPSSPARSKRRIIGGVVRTAMPTEEQNIATQAADKIAPSKSMSKASSMSSLTHGSLHSNEALRLPLSAHKQSAMALDLGLSSKDISKSSLSHRSSNSARKQSAIALDLAQSSSHVSQSSGLGGNRSLATKIPNGSLSHRSSSMGALAGGEFAKSSGNFLPALPSKPHTSAGTVAWSLRMAKSSAKRNDWAPIF